jgi:hypothetical protein
MAELNHDTTAEPGEPRDLETPLVQLPPETDDDSLIRWMLSLTPTRRLEVAQGFVDSVMAIRDGQTPA